MPELMTLFMGLIRPLVEQ